MTYEVQISLKGRVSLTGMWVIHHWLLESYPGLIRGSSLKLLEGDDYNFWVNPTTIDPMASFKDQTIAIAFALMWGAGLVREVP